jgi:putative ABC transport system ATP-binding protein
MTAMPALLSLRGVTRIFDRGAVMALDNVDLAIGAGECIAIVGASGSGKSSLVNMMSGIDRPTSGQVRWKDRPVASRQEWAELRRNSIGIVFQEFNLLPTLTAIENIEVAMFGRVASPRERRKRAEDALDRVGLAARAGHLPSALSGGERQRTAIARAIVNSPRLLLADEPTGNLDSVNAGLISDLLLNLQKSGDVTLILVTHDEGLAARCSRRIRIRDGHIVEDHDQRQSAAPPSAEAVS